MTSSISANGAISATQNDVCPLSLHQNLLVPWIDELNPNLESFYSRGNIGSLHDFAFVQSPNLKVCVYQMRTH